MGFPYTHTDKINFLTPPTVKKKTTELKKTVFKRLISESNFSYNEDTGDFLKFNSPFFKVPLGVNFIIRKNEIKYIVNLESLIRVIITIIVFSAFFSYSSLNFFFWFASIFTVSFYYLNIIIVNSYLNSLLLKILKKEGYTVDESEYLSEQQKQWTADKNRCSACGEFLSDIDITCPECGINLKRNKDSIPLDTSKYKNINIKYHYKKY